MIPRDQIDLINHNRSNIISNIKHRDISVYLFLLKEFGRGDIRENHPFQIVFRSFYAMRYVRSPWQEEYFNLFETCRSRDLDKNKIKMFARTLYDIPDSQNAKSLQFSFITKLLSMVDGKKWPIYDSNVAKVFELFGFKDPLKNSSGTFDDKFKKFWAYYKMIRNSYERISEENRLRPTIEEFQGRFIAKLGTDIDKIPNFRILDFIFWSYGDLINKRKFKTKSARETIHRNFQRES